MISIIFKIYLIFTAFIIVAIVSFIGFSLIKSKKKPESENVFKTLYNSFTDIKNYDDINIVSEKEREQFEKNGKKELRVYLITILLIFSLIPIYNIFFLKTVYDCCFLEKEELDEAVNVIENTKDI